MKKLVFGAAVALATALTVSAVESANVVGYNTKTTGADNNFLAAPFAAVGYTTTDIQQIKISDGGDGNIGWGTETFAIWEGVPSVVVGSEFFYYDPSMDPAQTATEYYWGDADCNKVNYSIAQGQSVVVNCAEDLEVLVAGEVADDDVSFTSIQDNNFIANPFPAAIDIQDIAIDDGGDGNIGWGTEIFSVWEGIPSVVVGSEFFYYDPSMDPAQTATEYYWGDADCNKVTYAISAGQGVVINCAADLTISIDAPYSL